MALLCNVARLLNTPMSNLLESLVKITAIVGALATAGALFFSGWAYYQSSQKQAEVEAINLLRDHWTLAADRPRLSSEFPKHKAHRVNEDGTFDRAYVRLASH